ncbi:STAS/SEC14 domain-containing protein [candidate division WOR-3 bacterium]|nr:STAS/SEC14 domain-containing protein [candidate division WOR-3 bacterium]
MDHQVSLDSKKNLIVKLSGELTSEEVFSVTQKMIELLKPLEKVHVLMDVTELKNVPPKAREEMAKSPLPPSDRIAVVGATPMIRVLGTLVLKVIPNVKKSRFFSDETQALAWLNEE